MNRLPAKPQILMSIFWPSFIAAGVLSGIVFAFIDPHVLLDEIGLHSNSRNTGYGLCFLSFWALGAISAAMAIFMLCTPTPKNYPRNQVTK